METGYYVKCVGLTPIAIHFRPPLTTACQRLPTLADRSPAPPYFPAKAFPCFSKAVRRIKTRQRLCNSKALGIV